MGLQTGADCFGGVPPREPSEGIEERRQCHNQKQREVIEEMEKTMKRWNHAFLLSFASLAIFILLATSFSAAAQGSSTTDTTALPWYLIKYAEHMSRGNATVYARIINEMITQEQLKQQMIASSKGAVLKPPQASPLGGSSMSYMADLSYYSPPTWDVVTGQVVGYVSNIWGLVGTNNGDYTHLFTNGWNEDYSNPIGGEAFEWGPVYNNYARGNVYVTAYNDQPCWQNYVMVTVTNTPGDWSSWHYIGYAAVTSYYYPSTYYIGYRSTSWSYVGVECWTPPPYPTYYYPLIMNSVYVDSVRMYW
jgi:hypothetical protein